MNTLFLLLLSVPYAASAFKATRRISDQQIPAHSPTALTLRMATSTSKSPISEYERLPLSPPINGYQRSWLWGMGSAMRKDFLGTIQAYTDYCDENNLPGVGLDFGILGRFDLIVDSKSVGYILEDREDNFHKSYIDKKSMGPLMGNGVLLSNGIEHTQKKRLILPSLDPKSLTSFVSIMENVSNNIASTLTGRVNVTETMTELAMDVVGLCLFSQERSASKGKSNNIIELINACHDFMLSRDGRSLNPPMWMPTKRNRQFRRNRKELDDFIYSLIEVGREKMNAPPKEGQNKRDLVSMLLSAKYEGTDQGLSDQELRDEVMTLFLAGHETSALALSFALWYLSDPRYAHWQDKIVQEHNEIQAQRGFTAALLQDAEALKNTRAVLCETLRLQGPVWAIDREVKETVVLPCGYKVKKGSIIFIANFAMHQRASVFDDPQTFKPERFLTWTKDPWDGPFDRSEYFPFASGRRRCIGVRFAQWEMLVALSTIISKVSPQRLDGQETLPVTPGITLRPKPGYQLDFFVRERAPQTT